MCRIFLSGRYGQPLALKEFENGHFAVMDCDVSIAMNICKTIDNHFPGQEYTVYLKIYPDGTGYEIDHYDGHIVEEGEN